MTPNQERMARHALGLDVSRRSYRNRYYARGHTSSTIDWLKLVGEGDAEHHDGWFNLTRQGAEKVLRPGESLDPEDFP